MRVFKATKKKKKRKNSVNRRELLRGCVAGAAVSVGLPLFDAAFEGNGRALAATGDIPRRFGVFFWGSGVVLDRWVPGTTGASWELSEGLAPLAPVKSAINLVSGMQIMTGNPRGHHAGTNGILSAAPGVALTVPSGAGYHSTHSQATIDQVIAREIGSETLYRSLEYGVHAGPEGSEGSTLQYLSHNGPNNVNPPEYSPRALFARVFGDAFTEPDDSPAVDPRVGLRRSVLDNVMADGASLRTRLGARDRQRLDQHMAGIRDLELRIARLEEGVMPTERGACAEPSVSGDGGDLRATNRIMADIMAMALACDQTRVFSNMFSGSVSNVRLPGTSAGHHVVSHDDGAPYHELQAATVYIMQCLSDMLQAFQRIPEGDGTLLDHMAVLASTDLSQDHRITDYPILVAGGGCGHFQRPGVHYRSDGENTSKVLLSLIRASGVNFDAYGHGGGRVDEGCSAIER